MRTRTILAAAAVVAAGALLGWLAASGRLATVLAQDKKSEPPAVLPRPEPPFQGKIGRTVKDSTPDFPKEVQAPKGAPNVLLILTDDVGFGASSTFGGPIPTPTFDKLAANGLRYNRFHTTALCSPTRAALISGRNHHTCASGVIMEMGSGYPGYNSLMPKSCGTVAQVLRGMATTRRGTARTITSPTGRAARPGRSTSGRPVWALNADFREAKIINLCLLLRGHGYWKTTGRFPTHPIGGQSRSRAASRRIGLWLRLSK